MNKLSSQTQAVLDAFRSSHTGQGCLAAALRAAAHQMEFVQDVQRLLSIVAKLE